MEGELAILWWRTWTIAFCHTFPNRLVPLLFGLTVQQTNDNHCHIVTTNASRLAVGCKAVVHHVLANQVQILLSGNSSSHEFDHSLGRLTIPYTYSQSAIGFPAKVGRGASAVLTITGNDQEFVIRRNLVCNDIGEGCDNLLLGREIGALLEFKVANGT